MDDYGINEEQSAQYNPLSYRMTIVKVQSGYIIQKGPAGDATYDVVQEDESKEEAEMDALAGREVLFHVMDFFGLIGSKHNKFRLNLTIDGEEGEVEEGNDE